MFDGFPQQGWQCPCCKRVYSPTTFLCPYCPGKTTVSNGSGTSIPDLGYTTCETGFLRAEREGLIDGGNGK